MTPMIRPEIRPSIFLPLQNAMAASIFAALLGAEFTRRLLYAHPDIGILWWLSTLANRTVMPVLHLAETIFKTPDRLVLGLAAGVVMPLIAWWARYWLATAVAGHVTLGALLIMAYANLRRGTLIMPARDVHEFLALLRPDPTILIFMALIGLTLVMCIADHVAFLRYLVQLFMKVAKRA